MSALRDWFAEQQAVLAKELSRHGEGFITTPTQSPVKSRLSVDSPPTHESETTLVTNSAVTTPKKDSQRAKILDFGHFDREFLSPPPPSAQTHESAIKRRKREMMEKRKHWHYPTPKPLDEVCKLNVIDFWKSRGGEEALAEWEYERQLDRMRWSSPESTSAPPLKLAISDESDEFERKTPVKRRRVAAPPVRRASTSDSDQVDEFVQRTPLRIGTSSRSRAEPAPSIPIMPKSPNKPDVIMDEEMTNKMPKKRGRKPNIVKVVHEVVVSPELVSPGLAEGQVQKVWGQGVVNLRSDPSETHGKPLPTWKNQPALDIDESHDGYDMLTAEEILVCSRLRLLPVQYLGIKDTLLTAAHNGQVFKKREAQKMCRVDVNKTAKVFDWFLSLGLLGPAYGTVDLNIL